MKAAHNLFNAGRKLGFLSILIAGLIGTASAQINGADPSLRIWLKADTLTGAEGSGVTNWLDSSSWGTLMTAPPLPPADPADDLTNHIPLLVTANNNGLSFNAVYFRQSFDPVTPDPTNGHLADRLWQANNLDESDPTLIDPGSNLTMIAVFADFAPNVMVGPHQAIFCKRGPNGGSDYGWQALPNSGCPYELGVNGQIPATEFVQYAGVTLYGSNLGIPTQPEWGIVIMEVTADGQLTFTQYYPSAGGWHKATQSGVPRASGGLTIPFTIAFHVQGAGGSASNPWGNGVYERFTGQVAEFALFNRSLSPSELTTIQDALLAKYFFAPGPPSFQLQPKSQTVNQYDPVTFTITPNGTPPFTYQWLKGAAPIAGATNDSYSIASVTTNDAGIYNVVLGNPGGSTNSDPATLTVNPDVVRPAVATALLNYATNTEVTVTFTELVDPATATNLSKYNINNSVTISDIQAVPQTSNLYWSNYVYSVVLTTSPITVQSKLTVNGVLDRAKNAATNSQADIFVPIVTAPPPTSNLLLWLAADTNVLTFPFGALAGYCYEWDDMSGTAHNAVAPNNGAEGLPIVGTAAFPNGIHPVLHFYGTNALQPQFPTDFFVQKFSVYVVGSADTSRPSRIWVGNWQGWALGTSDSVLGRLKWSSHTVSGDFSLEPAGAVVGNMVPAYVAGTFSNPGQKTLWLNGVQLGLQASTTAINYTGVFPDDTRGVAIGSLYYDSMTQPLIGDVAEVLIYTNVSSAQNTAVQNYIANKYFYPSATRPQVASATSSSAANTNVTVVFSQNVTAATAGALTNYSIDHGITVSAVTVVNATTVRLTTSALAAGPVYTLTVGKVADWAGNAVQANSQVQISGIPVMLHIQINGNSVSLIWDAPGWQLQSAGPLGTGWSTVSGASSPYPVTPSGAPKFYRITH